MDEKFSLFPIDICKQVALAEVRNCTDIMAHFGLSLTEDQMKGLIDSRFNALHDTGRVEFSGGVTKKLIEAFCDSPYVDQHNFLETLTELQDSFYYFKNEAEDLIEDDELIEFMKHVFDGEAQGSLEYLSETSLEDLCRGTRYGIPFDEDEGR